MNKMCSLWYLPGIFGPAPLSPYPSSDGMTNFRFSPSHIPNNPWSHPLITCPAPRVNTNGSPRSRLLSNFSPFSSVPYSKKLQLLIYYNQQFIYNYTSLLNTDVSPLNFIGKFLNHTIQIELFNKTNIIPFFI